MTLRRISFQSVPVADQDRALAFWRDVMGMEVQLDAPYQEGWRWIFLGIPGSDSRITFAKPDEIVAKEGVPVLALVCDDVDADCARWQEAGVTIEGGPDDAPWAEGVRWALIRDSEGNLVFVESLKG